MATIFYTTVQLLGNNDLGDTGIEGWAVTWAGMKAGDIGNPYRPSGYADKSIQVEGAFGVGTNVAAEGSNDQANFHALTNPQGTVIGLIAPGLAQMIEACVQVRPHVTAGDGTESLTVTMFFRKTQA